jgi:hypothetical protein
MRGRGGAAPDMSGPRTRLRALLLGLGIGAGAGALLLGLGGRLAMRLFAAATGRPGAFSVRGTLTVVFAGAVAGLIGGALFVAVQRRLPGRAPARGLAFGVLCLVLAAPGIRPPRPLTFGLFTPLFLVYGAAVAALWERTAAERRAAAPRDRTAAEAPPRSNAGGGAAQ